MQITSFVIEGRMPVDIHMLNKILISLPGADPGFQVRGAHLKKLRLAGGGAKMFGVFRVKKITILRQKIIFFPILGGGGACGVRPPWFRPWLLLLVLCTNVLERSDTFIR